MTEVPKASFISAPFIGDITEHTSARTDMYYVFYHFAMFKRIRIWIKQYNLYRDAFFN